MDRYGRLSIISPALLRTLDELRGEFQQALGAPSTLPAGHWAPAVDTFETATELLIAAELPGIKLEDIQVQIEGNELVLSGDRTYVEPQEVKAQRIERTYGSFHRTFQLPANVDRERIKASLKDGILTLSLPKFETAKPRSIRISIEE